MKTLIICLIFLFGASNLLSQSDTVRIIIDEPAGTNLPRNFRKSNDGFKRQYDKMPDTTGLSSLNISGSAEFSAMNFPTLINEIGKKYIAIVDLRQETHFLVNGITISWYGKYDWADVGLSRREVLALEKKRLDSVKSAEQLTVMRVIKKDKLTDTFLEFKDTVLNVETVQLEEKLVGSYGHGYIRITTTDHRQPLESDVDRFVEFVHGIRAPWLHFHCHAGDGRTTTFMTMYDMMKNAKNVSFDDIITRQYLIGGINLSKDDDFPAWDKQYAIHRTGFLKDFYEYCNTNNDGFKTHYSQWTEKQQK